MCVPVWNKVKSFLVQFGGCANLEYGHLWHSNLFVPLWLHFFCHSVQDIQYYNRLNGSLRWEDGNGEIGEGERFIAAGRTCQRAVGRGV